MTLPNVAIERLSGGPFITFRQALPPITPVLNLSNLLVRTNPRVVAITWMGTRKPRGIAAQSARRTRHPLEHPAKEIRYTLHAGSTMENKLRSCLMSMLALLMAAPVMADTPSCSKSDHSKATYKSLMSDAFKLRGEAPAKQTKSSVVSGQLYDPAVSRVQHLDSREQPPEPSTFRLAQSDLLDDLLKDLDDEKKDEANGVGEGDAAAEGNSQAAEPNTEADAVETMPPGEPAADSDEPNADTADAAVLGGSAADTKTVPNNPKAGLRSNSRTTGKSRAPVTRGTRAGAALNPANPTKNGQTQGPDLAARRANYANQPYTLAGILDDDKDKDQCCEREFCEAMWQCAGGKSLSTFGLWRRDFTRNSSVMWGNGNQKSCSPMANFKCSSRQNGQNGQYGANNSGMPYGGGMEGGYSNHPGGMYEPVMGEPTPAFPAGAGGHAIDARAIPLEPQPLPDLDAQIRRSRPKNAVGKSLVIADRRVDGTERTSK